MKIKDNSKKKFRGGKRRIRQIETWKEKHLQFDVYKVEKFSNDYVMIWIYPFFSLVPYPLPHWYKRLLVDVLLEVYDSWKHQLSKYDEEALLQLWIFENNFIHSQVSLSKGSKNTRLEYTFEDKK